MSKIVNLKRTISGAENGFRNVLVSADNCSTRLLEPNGTKQDVSARGADYSDIKTMGLDQ